MQGHLCYEAIHSEATVTPPKMASLTADPCNRPGKNLYKSCILCYMLVNESGIAFRWCVGSFARVCTFWRRGDSERVIMTDFQTLIASFQNCPCGQTHECGVRDIQTGSGRDILQKTVLADGRFLWRTERRWLRQTGFWIA